MYFSTILWLIVTDCLSVLFFSFDYLSIFVEENFLLSLLPFLSRILPITPFLIFHIFLILCPLFLICLDQVSAGPSIRKGTLPMLYHICGRFGGAGRGRGGFQVPSFPLPNPMGGRKG